MSPARPLLSTSGSCQGVRAPARCRSAARARAQRGFAIASEMLRHLCRHCVGHCQGMLRESLIVAPAPRCCVGPGCQWVHAGSGSVAGRRAGCPQIPRLRGPLSPQGPWCPMLSRQESSPGSASPRLSDWPILPKDRLPHWLDASQNRAAAFQLTAGIRRRIEIERRRLLSPHRLPGP